jgi:hypothetical protein
MRTFKLNKKKIKKKKEKAQSLANKILNYEN